MKINLFTLALLSLLTLKVALGVEHNDNNCNNSCSDNSCTCCCHKNFLVEFPDELLSKSLEYLDKKDLLHFGETCRHYDRLVQDRRFWKDFFAVKDYIFRDSNFVLRASCPSKLTNDTRRIAEIMKKYVFVGMCNLKPTLLTAEENLRLLQALKTDTKITNLIGIKIIEENEFEAIAKALEENKTLRHLDINKIQDRNKSTIQIAKALEKNKTLKTLKLSNNNDEAAEHIIKSLQKNSTLEKLHLNLCVHTRNCLSVLEKIINVLEQNQTLKDLNLSLECSNDNTEHVKSMLKHRSKFKMIRRETRPGSLLETRNGVSLLPDADFFDIVFK